MNLMIARHGSASLALDHRPVALAISIAIQRNQTLRRNQPNGVLWRSKGVGMAMCRAKRPNAGGGRHAVSARMAQLQGEAAWRLLAGLAA